MTDMQGPRGIRRHEFHLHPSAGTDVRAAVPRPFLEHPGDFGVIGIGR